MKLLMVLVLMTTVVGCSSNNNEKVTVKGERVSRDSVTIVKTQSMGDFLKALPDENFMYSFMKGQGFDEPEKITSFTNCLDLIQYATDKGLKISDKKANSLVLKSKLNKSMTFNFDNGSCLETKT